MTAHSALYSKATRGLPRCLDCVLLTGVFHKATELLSTLLQEHAHQFSLFTCCGFAEILFGGGKSPIEFEERKVEKYMHAIWMNILLLVFIFVFSLWY